MDLFVPPLKVHICWFAKDADPRCAQIALELYEFLHRPKVDDPVLRPGLEIPIEIGRDLGDLLASIDRGSEPAARMRLVIALLDRSAFFDEDARRVVTSARDRWADRRDDSVFLPILLHRPWGNQLAIAAADMLPGIALPDGDVPRWTLPADVGVVAGRALLRRLNAADPPRPRVFISHAKSDGEPVALRLAEYLHEDTRVDVWFDKTNVDRGEALARQLRKATSDGIVLVVRTDRYSESPWCAMELLSAKRARVPIVTLLTESEGEPATSAYGGNHRTMVWRDGREAEVVARCVQAWLHGHHFRAYAEAALALAGLPADSEVLSRRPELLDVMSSWGGRRLIVHPDPPLTEGEVTLLRDARPGVRMATPTTLLGRVLMAQDPKPPLTGTTVAFSLSVAPELPALDTGAVGSGLTQQHLDDVLYSIVLATLNSGAAIAYGGDFRAHQGYALRLSDLLRSRRRLGTTSSAQLICFLGQRSRPGDAADAIEFTPVNVDAPAGLPPTAPGPVRDAIWHLAMRQSMAKHSSARILLGGKTWPRTSLEDRAGYVGPWPGVLEEAWRTLRTDGALYIVGGFGGIAGAIAGMLRTGVIPPVFQRATHATNAPFQQLVMQVDEIRKALLQPGTEDLVLADAAGKLLDIEDLAAGILADWTAFAIKHRAAPDQNLRWKNQLTYEENLQLFRSVDRTEITYLVFAGLRQRPPSQPPTLNVALYHGDIATVPDVDGYAVTITPGVPPMGASAALDLRMDRRLTKVAAAELAHVTVVATDTSELAGTQVLLARMDLPPAGQVLNPQVVATVASQIADRADKLGIGAIACSPFATTLGVDVASATTMMVQAFRAAVGSGVHTIVLCEADQARYDAMRAALPNSIELRPGPQPTVKSDAVMLYIDVVPPTAAQPGTARATVLLPDGIQAIVPQHDATLTLDQWNGLRRRRNTYAESISLGQQLWSTLFSDGLRKAISAHTDRKIVIVTNDKGAGLPWEYLADDGGTPLGKDRCLIRRVALRGPAALPSRNASIGSRLRLLLVVNPLGDLPKTMDEATAIETALRGRPDVVIKKLVGGDATLEQMKRELETGGYDVVHYAGHAFFDPAAPAESGLRLADTLFTGAKFSTERERTPGLVYLSACESARLRGDPEPDAPIPLAEAVLRSGVSAMVGTFYGVADGAAERFAATVYGLIASGRMLGDAVREARKLLIARPAADWGNFMLYGDDTMVL